MLTSAQKRVDEAVYQTIQSIQEGTWQGGRNATFGLEEDGVALGTISPEVPEEDRAQIEEVAKQIADGEITGIPTTVS